MIGSPESSISQIPHPLRAPCAKSNCYPEGSFVAPKGVLPDGAVVFVSFSLVSVCFSVFDCELKRAGGRASSLRSRPPAVEYGRVCVGGYRGGAFSSVLGADLAQ